MTPEQRFGAFLQRLRKERQWTLRRASQAIEISHARLAELEAGVSRSTRHPTRPTREMVLRIAHAYKVSTDMLLAEAGYAVERPGLRDDEVLLLDLYNQLDGSHRAMAARVLRAMLE